MSERRNKKTILPDLIFSKFSLVLFVILFITILFGLAKGTIKNHKVNSEISELQKDITQLETQNQEFVQLIEYLKTDSFIEQEAKLKLGYKKTGENLVIIPQEEVNEEVAVNNYQTMSNPAKWWIYFFN
jgi:cell division protein FtsB